MQEKLRARRRELVRAFRAIANGRGWRMTYVCAFTAHAVYRFDGCLGHVIGDLEGRWWWSEQSQPNRLDGLREAADVKAACFAVTQAVRVRAFERRKA